MSIASQSLLFPERPARSLRLFEPNDGEAPAQVSSPSLPPDPTLRQAFELILLPELEQDQKWGTISAYRSALAHWDTRTLCPGVVSLSREERQAFVDTLRTSMLAADLAAATVSKTWRHLRAIFNRLGPPADRNPQGLGLLDRAPYMRPVKGPRKKVRRVVPDDEVARLYRGCDVARWPRCSTPAPELWRALLVLFRTYGPNMQDLLRLPMEAAYRGGALEGVTWSAPHPDRGNSLASEHGWLSYRRGKTGAALTLPLTACARAHLDRIRGDRSRVFPFTRANKSLYGAWSRICAEADSTACPQDLRKTCNTLWEGVHCGLGPFVLGHAESGVNRRFYVDPAKLIIEKLNAWPELGAFLAPPAPSRQLRLF